ncbi:hypothetical protein [Kitasatospora purpeofusca]|uniref:hypothetical protein n=1 Tax=Kitasatospora purpeofusca TaxID=67352 RepID=UPI002259ADCF|nr:hypothetical protein [Kitasatospora purpeofusca]MCX4758574.1 hypothetical protein [Kitasatospora purpeofusca]WSR30984.1 hypothetical protein OG715_08365 [Kitasatospora purpeofusca]WSR39017.1 hypothetical protein OG196_07865 [Kitasatospora purpeofusca]
MTIENPDDPRRFIAHLPIGERLPIPEDAAPSWSIFPYEGELTVRPLDAPVLPEPGRHGEAGAAECHECRRPEEDFVWTDEHWRLRAFDAPHGLPAVLFLGPREHHDLTDLPPARAVELGPMLQRVERAVLALGGIGRVHVNRWGDGGAHLHLWLIARPEGQRQLIGSTLALWMDLLPPLPDELRADTLHRIATAMAADGGTAHA